ncbi:cysteine hydrolase [Verminephrobacter eiseniae]|uniref:cysteine hydrolase family protein n=1 Tax=Verminephrobacter eiseniae TaxID=364317 RepID=UPI002237D29A|nr:isochorismatase family cysteine hydrolase [Verminephrobacter eiseniae]MCW5263590.1 cysteine hydrolase [Verminephrobacter eiseniae]
MAAGTQVGTHQSAVLALHYQNDVLHPHGKIRVGFHADSAQRQHVIAAAQALLSKARACAIPVVHVRIAYRPDYADLLTNAPIFRQVASLGAVCEGSWGAGFYADLAPLQDSPREFIVKHTRVNAFHDSPLEGILRILATRRLIVAGVATHSVVESTVRHAVDMGYEVVVNADACAAGSPGAHAASLENMRLIAEVCDGPASLWHLDAGAS